MRHLLALPLIVILMATGAAAMLVPASHALALGNERVARAFLFSAMGFLLIATMIGMATAGRRAANPARAQLATLVGAYLVLPLMLAVPFQQAVRDTTFFNAWFEMLSCLTTTGATLYDTPDRLAPSLHLWRVLVGWLGGFLVLVGAAAILAPLDLGGAEVISGRVPGRGQGGGPMRADAPRRLIRHTVTLLPAYAGLTLLLWIGLLTTGMDSFPAFCFALSTLSSSGIVPGTGLIATGAGIGGEMLIFLFLCIGLTRRSLPGAVLVDRSRPLWRDHEVQTAAAVMAVVPALLFLPHWLDGADPQGTIGTALRALWGALFTTLSFLTTSGFESAAWQDTRLWSGLATPGLVLVGLAMTGGGIATTTGGLKLLRVHALFQHGNGELRRVIHPSHVGGGGEADRRLRGEGAFAAWVFFMLYGLTLAMVMAALTLQNLPFDTALILSVAAISTTGPLATLAADMPIRYADLSATVKAVLAGGMILGRLEVLAILALLAPSAWRR